MEIEQTPTESGPIESGPDVIVRTFAAELSAGDGRTVDVRIVPYGERIVHDDGLGGVPKGIPYAEEWMPGAFAHQANATFRVKAILANFEHGKTLRDVVGHGLALEERRDGLYGSFKMHEDPDGDKALMLVREGVLSGVSLEARPVKNVRTAAGVIQRVKANLRGIAFMRGGEHAYAGAQVLAVRAVTSFDEEMLPVEIDPGLLERCERLGVQVPERMKAHPGNTGTPAESGTPKDGTRPETDVPTS